MEGCDPQLLRDALPVLFGDVTEPPPEFVANGEMLLDSEAVVSMTGGAVLVRCLSDPVIFLHRFPFVLQAAVLRGLVQVLGRDIYSVARFRGGGLLGSSNSSSRGLVSRLLALITHASKMERQDPEAPPSPAASAPGSLLAYAGSVPLLLMDRDPAFLEVLELLVRLVSIIGSAGCVHVKDLKVYLLLLASKDDDDGGDGGDGGDDDQPAVGCPRRLRSMLLRALPTFAGPRLPEATQSSRDALSDFAWSSSSAAAAARAGGERTARTRMLRQLPDMPSPPSFFCFGGGSDPASPPSGGIELPFRDWPFEQEYQVAFWVRLESASPRVTTLFALSSEADGSGMALTIDQGNNLNLRVGDSGLIAKGGRPTRVRCGTLRLRTWHHVLVTHMRPRKFGSISSTFFAKDSLIIHLDLAEVVNMVVPVPRVVACPLDTAVLGRGLHGQLGEVFILHEHLPIESQALVLARHSRLRGADQPSCDLDGSVLGLPSTGSKSLSAHLLAVYHPQRITSDGVHCSQNFPRGGGGGGGGGGGVSAGDGHIGQFLRKMSEREEEGAIIDHLALDVHNGYHGRFRQRFGGKAATTHAWSLSAPQALIGSLGGVQMLLPLFSSIFNAAPSIDDSCGGGGGDDDRFEDSDGKAETGQSSRSGSADQIEVSTSLITSVLSTPDKAGSKAAIRHRQHARNSESSRQNIAARLNVLSCFIAGQGASQQECVRIGAIGMIEFAIFHTPPRSLAKEHPQRLVAAVECLCGAAARGGAEVVASLLKRLRDENGGLDVVDGAPSPQSSDESSKGCGDDRPIHVPFVPAWRSTTLCDQATARLLFNLRLWGYGGTRALQLAFFARLRRFARAQPLRVRQLVGVHRLLDAMAELYPDDHFVNGQGTVVSRGEDPHEDDLSDDESDEDGNRSPPRPELSPVRSPAASSPLLSQTKSARKSARRRRPRQGRAISGRAASIFTMLDKESGLPRVDDLRSPARTLASQRLSQGEREEMRLQVLSIIWEAMTSFGEAENGEGMPSSTAPSSPTYMSSISASSSPMSGTHHSANDMSLEAEMRAILQFLCNPNPAGSSNSAGMGAIDRDAGMIRDVTYLFVGLLRRASPPPGLYPALHSIAQSANATSSTMGAFGIGGDAAISGPSVLGALLVNRVVDSNADDQRSTGLQLLVTLLARLSAHCGDLLEHHHIRGSRSGSSSDMDYHESDRGNSTAARFYAMGGTAILAEVLERHSSWLAGGTYAALIEMMLIGDEDNVGWNFDDEDSATGDSETADEEDSDKDDDATSSDGADVYAKKGLTTARPSASPAGQELASLMGKGKILTATQQARVKELMHLESKRHQAVARASGTFGDVFSSTTPGSNLDVGTSEAPSSVPPPPPDSTPPFSSPAVSAPPPPSPLTAATAASLLSRSLSPVGNATNSTTLHSARDDGTVVGEGGANIPFAIAPPQADFVFSSKNASHRTSSSSISPSRMARHLRHSLLECQSSDALSVLLKLLPRMSKELQTRACADLLRLLSLRPAVNAAAFQRCTNKAGPGNHSRSSLSAANGEGGGGFLHWQIPFFDMVAPYVLGFDELDPFILQEQEQQAGRSHSRKQRRRLRRGVSVSNSNSVEQVTGTASIGSPDQPRTVASTVGQAFAMVAQNTSLHTKGVKEQQQSFHRRLGYQHVPSIVLTDLQSSSKIVQADASHDVSTTTDEADSSGAVPALMRRQTTLDLAELYGGLISAQLNSKDDLVWEYQRWMPIKGWGSSLLPTDPGRWSSSDASEQELDQALRVAKALVKSTDGLPRTVAYASSSSSSGSSAWSNSLADVAPALPTGWEVWHDWEPVFTRCAGDTLKGLTSGGDAESASEEQPSLRMPSSVSAVLSLVEASAWQYGSSNTFRSTSWSLAMVGSRTVRRRLWRRTLRLVDSDMHASAASSAPSDGPTQPIEEKNLESDMDQLQQQQQQQRNSFEYTPLSRLANKIYVRLLAHDMKYRRNGWHTSVELMLSLQKRSDNGEAVTTVLLSGLIYEMHQDLLAVRRRYESRGSVGSGGAMNQRNHRASTSFFSVAEGGGGGEGINRRGWLSSVDTTHLWENIRDLVHFVSVWTGSGRIAVAGAAGAKRAIVLQRRLGETKGKMTKEQLNRYSANDLSPPPDLFRDLRRRLDEELRGGGIEARIASVAGGLVGDLSDDDDDDDDDGADDADGFGSGENRISEDDLEDEDGDRSQFDPSYYSHGMSGNTSGGSRLLRMEFGGLDGYDHGGVRRFVTTANDVTSRSNGRDAKAPKQPSPQHPLQPLSTMASGGERKLFIALQLSHLMDLLIFPKEIDCRFTDESEPDDDASPPRDVSSRDDVSKNADNTKQAEGRKDGSGDSSGHPSDATIRISEVTVSSSVDDGLIERLESIHRVGCFTYPMTMHEWTPTTPRTVFSLMRSTIMLLIHCEPTDPQLPAICQRLRRLSHFLVSMAPASSSGSAATAESAERTSFMDKASVGGSGLESDEVLAEADLWVLMLFVHLHNKLKEIRMITYSMCDNSDLIDGERNVSRSFEVVESLKPFQSPFRAVGGPRSDAPASDGSPESGDSEGDIRSKRSGKYSHRAFLHAPWEPYTAEESAAIAAARATTSGEGSAWKSGKIALPGSSTGMCYDVRWGYAASGQNEHMTDLQREMIGRDGVTGQGNFRKLAWAMRAMNELNLGIPMDDDIFKYISDESDFDLLDSMMVEVNISEGNFDTAHRHVRMVREDPVSEEGESPQAATAADGMSPPEALGKDEGSAKHIFMDKKCREAMLISARLIFGIVSGLWRARGEDVLAPRLHQKASVALRRLSTVIRRADTAAVNAALNFKDAAMRRREGKIAQRLRERVNVPLPPSDVELAAGAGNTDVLPASPFAREESDEWVDVERSNGDQELGSEASSATVVAADADANELGVKSASPMDSPPDSIEKRAPVPRWEARKFLAEPLAWLSSHWLDDDGNYANGGLIAPTSSSPDSSSSVCAKFNHRSAGAASSEVVPPPLAMDGFARQLERVHDNETTLLEDQRSNLSQRWAQFNRDTRLADQQASEAKERLEKQGALLTWRLEDLEVGSRQALDLEVEQCYLVGAKAWVACLRRLRVEWTPWFQMQHGNSGVGLVSRKRGNQGSGRIDRAHDTAKKIGWVMSEHEDTIGRRLLLMRDYNYQSHAGASYREAKLARNAALLSKVDKNATEDADATSAASADGEGVDEKTIEETLSAEATAAVAKATQGKFLDPSKVTSVNFEEEDDDEHDEEEEEDGDREDGSTKLAQEDEEGAESNISERAPTSEVAATEVVMKTPVKDDSSSEGGTKGLLRDGDEVGDGFEVIGVKMNKRGASGVEAGDEEGDVLEDQRFDMSTYVAEGRDGGYLRHRRGEHTIRTLEVRFVRPEAVTPGRLVLTNRSLYFHPERPNSQRAKAEAAATWGGAAQASDSLPAPYKAAAKKQENNDRRWDIDTLVRIYGRRFLLKPDCALEFFFADGSSAFIVCQGGKAKRDQLWRDVKTHHGKTRGLPLLEPADFWSASGRNLNPRAVLSRSGLTEAWQQRRISNFEYLMRLNSLAGRSRNDITQYPVFPWILADYESEELNLEDPRTFRDLSKPVGALQPERLEQFRERYECYDDPFVPKFMYGSHYSSAGIVLHYLVRQEPFTTMAVNLHDGRFDCPDRLFLSMEGAWHSCNNSMTDVKELIPELFYDASVLMNSNNLPLGMLQTGEMVNDVQLPPWAKGDADEFIRLHRLALESEYVSQNLHKWVDLIFGAKQVGESAVEASNLFYYLTYEGAVDLALIEDPILREATTAQIKHFGQTPSQLMTQLHPPRDPPDSCPHDMAATERILKKKNMRTFTYERPNARLAKGTAHAEGPSLMSFAQSEPLHGEPRATQGFSKLYDEGSFAVAIFWESKKKRMVVITNDFQAEFFSWSNLPSSIVGSGIAGAPLDTAVNAGEGTMPYVPFTLKPVRGATAAVRPLPCRGLRTSANARFASGGGGESRSRTSSVAKRATVLGSLASLSSPPSPPAPLSSKSSTLMSSFLKRGKRGSKTPGTNASRPAEDSAPPIPRPHSSSEEMEAPKGTAEGNQTTAASQQAQGDNGDDVEERRGAGSAFNAGEVDEESQARNGALGSVVGPWQFAVASERNILLSCGYWDGMVKAHSLDGSGPCKQLSSSRGGHRGFINCLALGKDGYTLVTGGSDATVRVWCVDNERAAAAMSAVESAAGNGSIDSFGIGAVQSHHPAGGASALSPAKEPSSSSSSSSSAAAAASAVSLASSPSSEAAMSAALDVEGKGSKSGGGGDLDSRGASSDLYLKHGGQGLSVPVYDDTGGTDCGDGVLRRSHVLCGHDAPVTCVAISTGMDMIVSGASDGAILVHTARQGRFIRKVRPFEDFAGGQALSEGAGGNDAAQKQQVAKPTKRRGAGGRAVNVLAIDDVFGDVVAHSWGPSRALAVLSVNEGRKEGSIVHAEQHLSCLLVSRSGRTLISGGSEGLVTFRSLPDLTVAHTVDLRRHGPVRAISYTPDGGNELVLSSANGKLHVLTDPSHHAVERVDLLAETFVG